MFDSQINLFNKANRTESKINLLDCDSLGSTSSPTIIISHRRPVSLPGWHVHWPVMTSHSLSIAPPKSQLQGWHPTGWLSESPKCCGAHWSQFWPMTFLLHEIAGLRPQGGKYLPESDSFGNKVPAIINTKTRFMTYKTGLFTAR